MRFIILFFAISFFSNEVHAFNGFHWLNDAGQSATNIKNRSDINGEYDSDFLAYQKGFEWQYEYLKAANAFDVSVGSLSSKEFLFDQRLKLEKLLTEKFFFGLEWLQARDFDQDFQAFGYEVGYLFFPKIAISAIGSPSFYKSEDDVGAKVTVYGNDVKSEFAAIKYDFQKNQRDLTAERWAEGKAPWALYYQSTWMPKGKAQFTTLGLMNQFHSRRENNVTGTYAENSAWRAQVQHWEKDRFGVQLQWDQIFRSTQTDDSLMRKRLWFQAEKDLYYKQYKLTPGFNVFHRDYYAGSSRAVKTTWLPTFWLTLPGKQYESFVSIWSVGVDAAFAATNDQRLNLKNSLKFHENAELNWLLTFDVDHLISNEFWEGGNMQLRMMF